MEASKIKIAYWGMKGRGEVLRHIAAYTGLDFENKLYTDPNEWFAKDKPLLKCEFPNLPYVLDGDVVVTESDACVLYLIHKSKKLDLLGTNAEEIVHLAQINGVLNDSLNALVKISGNKELSEADLAKGILDNVGPKITALAKHLGSKEWFLGRITVVDFFFVQLLKLLAINSTIVKDLNLCDYIKRYDELPAIKAYTNSDKDVKGPFPTPPYINAHFKLG